MIFLSPFTESEGNDFSDPNIKLMRLLHYIQNQSERFLRFGYTWYNVAEMRIYKHFCVVEQTGFNLKYELNGPKFHAGAPNNSCVAYDFSAKDLGST